MATKNLKINICNYEQGRYNGILSKFANKMFEELKKVKDIEVTLGNLPSMFADINHHINYLPYRGKINDPTLPHYVENNTKNTLMITHIFEGYKRKALEKGMQTADVGICMSDGTKNQLVKWGFDKKKLTTILPAHDRKPRRHQVVAILTNVYPDNCKREEMFATLAKTLDVNKWAFRIMGSGWHDILVPLVAEGLQVDYFAEFEVETHDKILNTSDYCLYFGEDEGSMALLDAKNAGLKLIAPNIGFNKDIGVDYPFHTQKELNAIFEKLSINPVESWSWKSYCDQHLKLWRKLVK